LGVILSKCALACLVGVIAVWLPGYRPLLDLPRTRYRWALWILAVAARLPLFVLLYLVLGNEVPSDVSGYYVPEARKALAGQLVYRDFASSYGPGFPYLVGLFLWLCGSAKALVLVAVAFELAALEVWGRLARQLCWDESRVRRGELLYLASAVPLLTIAVAGQNQSWLALSIGLSLFLARRGRPAGAALAALWGLLFVKALAVPFWVPAFALARRSGKGEALRFSIWLVVTAALALGVLLLLGADPTLPLRLEAGRTSPGNLPFLISAWLSTVGVPLPSWLAWLGFVAVALWLVRRVGTRSMGPQQIWNGTAALWLAFLIFAPKAFPGYFVLAALPIAMACASRTETRAVYAVWQAALAVLPSIWFRLFPTASGSGGGTTELVWLTLLHVVALVPGLWLLRAAVLASDGPGGQV
jgi:hypothetical protein